MGKEIDIVLDPRESNVFRRAMQQMNCSQGELLTKIVHDWARRPVRVPGSIELPSELLVLYRRETLRAYLNRTALVVADAVRAHEGSMQQTARRLGYERTAFSKFYSRLKAGQVKHVFSPADLAPQGHSSPLRELLHDYAGDAFAYFGEDRELTASALCVSPAALDVILGMESNNSNIQLTMTVPLI